jgi:internalin A
MYQITSCHKKIGFNETGETLSFKLPSGDIIEYLTMEDCYNLSDLTFLKSFPRLRVMKISDANKLTDIKPLSKLKHLTKIDLDCANLTDLSPLSALPRLSELSLTNCVNLTDLSPLSVLTQLSTLTIENCQALTDLRPLAGIKFLRILKIDRCINIDNIPFLNGFNGLETFHLYDNKYLTSISINEAKNLRKLSIYDR